MKQIKIRNKKTGEIRYIFENDLVNFKLGGEVNNLRIKNFLWNSSYLSKKEDGGELFDINKYQTGGQLEPEYEAEHNEVVIKSNPNDDIYMLGSGKIADESSFAGTIKGDYHGEDSDNDGQEGEAMKGGEYILSDVKTINYEDSGKGKPSVAAIARPLVKKIQELEKTRDAYKQNTLKYAVKDLQKIKATFDMNKQQDALCDQVLQALGQNSPALKSKLLSGLKSGELTTQDLQGMLQETQNTQPNV